MTLHKRPYGLPDEVRNRNPLLLGDLLQSLNVGPLVVDGEPHRVLNDALSASARSRSTSL